MIRFENDYGEGAHPAILQRLLETNEEQAPGYGGDLFCERARELIKDACGAPDADVHFMVGGTQANKTVIASILRPHQGVLSPETGHVATHETGAIEATGHKVLTLPHQEGKITAQQIREYCLGHRQDPAMIHSVQPGLAYISQPTEYGTVYTRQELEQIKAACQEADIYFFVDGARLGYAAAAGGEVPGLEEMAHLCDVFYIGGTKVGAMFGEAIVISHPSLKPDFRYQMKQQGGLLAKGRYLGLQFETLFTDGLYGRISQRAVDQAGRIRDAFEGAGIPMAYHSPTNQQFPILTDGWLKQLGSKYVFAQWEKTGDGRTVVRFCTSWATKDSAIDALVADIERYAAQDQP